MRLFHRQLALILTALAAPLAPVRADLEPVGPLFQVNSEIADDQRARGIDSAADGDFVVVWESDDQDGSLRGVFGQRFDGEGQMLGTEFAVNTYTVSDQEFPKVGMAATAKSFVVVWADESLLDGSPHGIFGQRYASNGMPAGGNFQVNTYTAFDETFPDVGVQPDGDFLAVWSSLGSPGRDGDSAGVFGQRYNSSGATVGGEFQVNTYTLFGQNRAAIGTDSAGRFVVAWESGPLSAASGQDGSSYGIFGQRFTSSGLPLGTEFMINTYTVSAQEFPAVAVDPDGDFLVTWAGAGAGDTTGIFAQRFNSSGASVGTEFLVNTATIGSQSLPDAAIDSNGNFLIVWQETLGSADVYGQFYLSDGTPSGGEFVVNDAFQSNTQMQPLVAAIDGFVVAWTSAGQDTSNDGVFAQRFATVTPPTSTPTEAPTETPSPSPTASPSQTPTDTPTATATSTPTATPSQTATSTPTATPSGTPTSSPTATPSGTATATPAPEVPMIEGGIQPGSTRVEGVGSGGLADGCIVICSTGENSIDETTGTDPGCSGDDQTVGSGGTNANGAFQSGGQPGIAISPPAAPGEVLCVTDVCNDRDGNCVMVINPAPAPALSLSGIMLAFAALSTAAFIGIARRRR